MTGVRPRADDPLQVLSAGPASLPSAFPVPDVEGMVHRRDGLPYKAKQHHGQGRDMLKSSKVLTQCIECGVDSHQWTSQ